MPFQLPDLPIKACLDELTEALSKGHVTLSASTGSGKTTVVPLSLLSAAWLAKKKIIMLEPRRPAARMAAHRMAFLIGENVGQTVGYQIRFERKISSRTRIEVLTEGLLLKRLQADPMLEEVGLVIFDEYHERSLIADLSLALCLDVCTGLRDDLRLLVMSASLDTGKLSELLNAREISSEGQLYPVSQHYASSDLPLKDVVDACVPLITQALQTVSGDVLVFLPGRREIHRLQTIAAEKWAAQCEVLPLHGELTTAEQDRVLKPSSAIRRRLVLSTDIAETSLTIEGIEAVVDGGRVRKPVFQAGSGLTRLETRWVSKASALQRAGRAGRLGPGQCFRAWTASRQQRLEDFITPEILQADLAAMVLELAAWGVNDPDKVIWLDKPPPAHWAQATALLNQLQALDKNGQITQQGRLMSALPVHPRLAHMLLNARTFAQQQTAADIAALLSDRDPLIRQSGMTQPIDISLRLMALESWRQKHSVSHCNKQVLQQLDRLSDQFLRMLKTSETVSGSGALSIGGMLAMAYPDRMAKNRGTPGSFVMRHGRGVNVPQDDSLACADYLVVAEMDAGQRDARAWLAARLELNDIESLFADQIQQERVVQWDTTRQKVVARQRVLLNHLILSEKQVPLEAGDAVTEILIDQIKSRGISLLGDVAAFHALCARIQIMHDLYKDDGWPDVSESALLDTLDGWLLPWLEGIESMTQLGRVNMTQALLSWLGWEKQQRLESLLPLEYVTAAGTRRKIHYARDELPVLRVPLQEMLGLSASPVLANGQIGLVMHLLSPAGRPLQVTQDLAAFWKGSYQDVKKEMRGRYPKHVWPDDPANAKATRFTKKRQKPE